MIYIPLSKREDLLDFNLEHEFRRLLGFIKSNVGFLSSYIKNRYFLYPHRGMTRSIDELVELQFTKHANFSEDNFLYMVEFFSNLYNHYIKAILDDSRYDEKAEYFITQFIIQEQNIEIILSKLGYKIVKTEKEQFNIYEIVKIDELAEKVAVLVDDSEVTENILSFLTHGKSIQDKTIIIESMYKHYESIKSKSGSAGEALQALLNNGLRHTKRVKNRSIQNFIDKETKDNPKFMDQIFNLLIECYYHSINYDFLKTIDELKKNKTTR